MLRMLRVSIDKYTLPENQSIPKCLLGTTIQCSVPTSWHAGRAAFGEHEDRSGRPCIISKHFVQIILE